ncbi:rCG61575 [Rattus norvegicus]|uniref:RCG61575 n=1 Tax=Rattus norvegicus TaxID=10116 RepID=A6HC02_RAT|nr:rCG61575 [Rattus norvegicus]
MFSNSYELFCLVKVILTLVRQCLAAVLIYTFLRLSTL